MHLTETLALKLKEYMPEETILITPSLGEGRRLLQTCAEAGHFLMGVRVATPQTLAREICAAALAAENAPRLMDGTEAQELLFRCLMELPETGFFARAHAKERKTAELMYGTIMELNEAEIPAIGGNERKLGIQTLREAYSAAKGSTVLDSNDLLDMAMTLAEAYFAGRKLYFVALGSSIFGRKEKKLIDLVSAGRLSVVPVEVSDAVQIPSSVLAPDAVTAAIDTDALTFVRCRGVETEVRFIFRDILKNRRNAEDCAVVYMSSEYAAVLDSEAQFYHIPISISGGVPLTGSKVYYALNELDHWAASEFDAEKLRSLILSKAISLSAPGKFVRRLRAKNVGWGKERYLSRFLTVTENEAYPPEEEERNEWKAFLENLFAVAGKSGDPEEQKAAVDVFLRQYVSIRKAEDASAAARARALLNSITWLEENETVLGRLLALMEKSVFMTGHEEQGKLFATSLSDAFCTGRKVIYICGMSRFCMQGSRQESPLLLDEERKEYGLRTLSEQEKENTYRLQLLLLQHSGEVILSYCDYDTERMVGLQPAPVCRELCEEHEVRSISYIPEEKLTLGDFESRGDRLEIKPEAPAEPDEDLEAAVLADKISYPDKLNAMTFSPTSLEEALKCPLKFYLNHILGLKPAELPKHSADVWLDNKEMGSFCHAVLEKYYAKAGTLEEIFAEELNRLMEEKPAGSESAVQNDTDRALAMVNRALEWTRSSGRRILATEKKFGRSAGEEPLTLAIGSRTIRLCGSIDRVDELPDGAIAILDYKTGAPQHYRGEEEKIRLQPYLYTLAAEKLDETIKIADFGYLFLKNTADYLAVPQTEAARELKASVICDLLDWMQDETKAQTAVPAFVIGSEKGIVGLGDPKTRREIFAGSGWRNNKGCRGGCEYGDFCLAAAQIARQEQDEESAEAGEENSNA